MKVIDKCIILLSLALLFSLFAVLAYREPEKNFSGFSVWDFYAPELTYNTVNEPDEPVFCFSLAFHDKMQAAVDDMLVTYSTIETEYIGTYYITAYCPWECGYNGYNYPAGWRTASGEICHRADWEHRYSEPTTCAISRSVHSFGDTFYLPDFDRVFVAEDTGSGVNGYHLDLFYESYEEMASFPTGYYPVHSVNVTEHVILGTKENIERYIA